MIKRACHAHGFAWACGKLNSSMATQSSGHRTNSCNLKHLLEVIGAAALAVIVVSQTIEHTMAVDRPSETAFPTRSPAVGKHGRAATSQPLGTQAAIEILQGGGNAVDAAI